MKSEWEQITKNIQDLGLSLEDLLEMLPMGKKYFKAKQGIEKQWRELGRSVDKFDPYISDLIDSITLNHPWINDDFLKTWQLYKDYLFEQHGIRMKSRMEQQRIEWLITNSENDYKKAIMWLKYFMASGNSSLYIPKNISLEHDAKNTESKKAEFKLPAAKKS
jgi:hypothetical protein